MKPTTPLETLAQKASAIRQERSSQYSGLLEGASLNAAGLEAVLRAYYGTDLEALPVRIQLCWQLVHKALRMANRSPKEDDFVDAFNYLTGAYEAWLAEKPPSPAPTETVASGSALRKSLLQDWLVDPDRKPGDGVSTTLTPDDIEEVVGRVEKILGKAPRVSLAEIPSSGHRHAVIFAGFANPSYETPVHWSHRRDDFYKWLETAEVGHHTVSRMHEQDVFKVRDHLCHVTGVMKKLKVSPYNTQASKWEVVEINPLAETPEGRAEDRSSETRPAPLFLENLTVSEIAALPPGTLLHSNLTIGRIDACFRRVREDLGIKIKYKIYPVGARGNQAGPTKVYLINKKPCRTTKGKS